MLSKNFTGSESVCDSLLGRIRVSKGFRAPGLRAKNWRAPGLQDENVRAPGLHIICSRAPGSNFFLTQ